MPAQIKAGLCFQLNDPKTGEWTHPWVVVTSPEGPEQDALCVNVTDKATFDDVSCVLLPGEHSIITKESVIAYRWARVLPLANLTASSASSMVKQFPPVSAAILKRIQEGGVRSDFITPRNRKLIEQELGKRK